ncbi:MAG: hypothetical protein A2Y76_07610 [Planctomycetes bacterium RBG_13_60_9]|nr:MAG: hypothetical protein A2Y76_07610 [Planctomycetes bacterium RBG_13_60_9]
MSEYQYYEFQAIDKPLTQKQMEELRSYSTRARITRTSFVNDYSWGNFKGDEDKWMERYFDAFLYLANWGTHTFKLRLPSRLLDLETAQQYCVSEYVFAWESGDHVILSFTSDEEGEGWIEGEGHLSSLIPVRAELAHGDLRALYLGWLLCVQSRELDDEEIEPPVPPGLGQLSASLQGFADFLRVDEDLLYVAAQASEPAVDARISRKELHDWIAELPAGEKDDVLTRLVIDEDSSVATELFQWFLEHRKAMAGGFPAQATRRTVGELLRAAETRAEERQQAEARRRAEEAKRREQKAAAARAAHLARIADQEPRLWDRVDRLIAERKPKSYDEAVALLIDLRDLAQRSGRSKESRRKLRAIRLTHARKPSLLKRLDKAGLE